MGLGGDDSWTRSVHDRFLVRPGRFDFGLRLHAVPAGADADELYRRRAFRARGGAQPQQQERKAAAPHPHQASAHA